jgi:outer membrane protein assembly factor BamB
MIPASNLMRGLSGACLAGVTLLASACSGAFPAIASYSDRMDRITGDSGMGRFSLRWSRRLGADLALNELMSGVTVPVERAVPTLDSLHDRIFVGSSTGQLWCFTGSGLRLWMYQAGGGIGAPPSLSLDRRTIYVGSDDGFLHALDATSGRLFWRGEMLGSLGKSPVVTEDAVYIVTDNDVVGAYDRSTGDALWRFERQAPEGFYVTDHAGLVLADRRLITGFTDGAVVALDPSDGRVLWVRDTTADMDTHSDELRFTDVDTTPVVLGESVYVASFAGGLYALEAASGSVRWVRPEWTGVVALADAGGGRLALASGDFGIQSVRMDNGDRLWSTPVRRGAPTSISIVGDSIVYGETTGGLVTLTSLGREISRYEDGHGFAAPIAIEAGLAAVVSNAGTLLVFAVR